MQRRLLRLGLLLVLAAVLQPLSGQTDQDRRVVAFWSPREADISADHNSKDYKLLRFLLLRSEPQRYSIKPGDTLNLIVRTVFFVSEKNQPNAYALYVQTIVDRNKGLDPRKLMPDTYLDLPSGPRYSRWLVNAVDFAPAFAAPLFAVMSREAQAAGRAIRGEELNRRLQKASEYFVRSGSAAEVRALGIVAPVNSTEFPETEMIQIQPVSAIPAAGDELPEGVTQDFLPATFSPNADCANCKSCADVLGVPKGTPEVTGRILVIDTGVDPTSVSPDRLLYSAAGKDFTDVAGNRHGSFVYSQLVASKNGILSSQSVYVAKAAVAVPKKDASAPEYEFRISEITKAIRRFLGIAQFAGATPRTSIINISAEGPIPQDMPEVPICSQKRILCVAAAGNHSNKVDPEHNLFATVNDPNRNLLVVGALDNTGDRLAGYSNFHSRKVDIFAQGSCICGQPGQLSGTSQAAPVVASAAAALAAKNPKWEALDVKWRLISTTDVTSVMTECGSPKSQCGRGGVVNLQTALIPRIVARIRKPEGSSQPIEQVEVDEIRFPEIWQDTWFKLLIEDPAESDHIVLRLHRVSADTATPTDAFFLRMKRADEPDLALRVSSDAALDLVADGKVRSIRATDIEDIIMPLSQGIRSKKGIFP